MQNKSTYYPQYPRAPGRIGTLFLIAILIIARTIPVSYAEPQPAQPYMGLPKITLQLTGLDESGDLIYIGVDLAVFEEVDTVPGDSNDEDGDGKVFRAKEGKVKRFLTTHTNITINLGQPSEYKKGVRHKLAMRTLYTPTGTSTGEIIIADQSNGKDGWVPIPGSEFLLSYFVPEGDDNRVILHTDKWEANRMAYNASKVKSRVVPDGMEMRPYSTFWSGEKFVLEIKTTEPISPAGVVTVALLESTAPGITASYSTSISAYEQDPETTDGAIYRGEIWSAEMLDKWGNYTPKPVIFEVSAIISGAAVETRQYTVIMDNREPYYRARKRF